MSKSSGDDSTQSVILNVMSQIDTTNKQQFASNNSKLNDAYCVPMIINKSLSPTISSKNKVQPVKYETSMSRHNIPQVQNQKATPIFNHNPIVPITIPQIPTRKDMYSDNIHKYQLEKKQK